MTHSPTMQALEELEAEMKGRATLVIDTSVLVSDPDSLYAFSDCDLVIPMTVIEELDNLKSRQDQAGANARAVIRLLEDIRTSGQGRTLTTPVDLPNGSTLKIEPNGLRLDELETYHLPPNKADHRILAAALGQQSDGRNVAVVSCDGAMRLKADTLGLTAVDYAANNAPFTTRDKPGWKKVELTTELIADLYDSNTGNERMRVVPVTHERDLAALEDVCVNEFVLASSGTSTALARREKDGLRLLAPSGKTRAWDLRSRNKEQQFALDLLTDPTIEVVALSGRAGTGKTILAIAAALEQTFEDNRYDRVMILRPMYAIAGQDLGYLPGEVEDKVAPWFDAVVDAMVALSTRDMKHKEARDMLNMWVDQGKLAMEPVTFLRGRSLSRTILVVDETQNLETAAAKTVLTRLGEGSKVILVGDPQQADNPYVDEVSNGLTAVVAAFRGQDIFGHVELTECERSRIADLAADLL